jgi:hypothetical protein
MTNLPATLVEAEAFDFARQWIKDHCEPNGAFHPDTIDRHHMKRLIERHPFVADQIVWFAEKGDKEAWLALEEVIAERINRNEPLGAVLGGYAIRSRNPLRQQKSGPAPAENFRRDVGIFLLLKEMVDRFPKLGFHKNPASRQPTITSIAAVALSGAGIGISIGPQGVRKVWNRQYPVYSGNYPAGYISPLD